MGSGSGAEPHTNGGGKSITLTAVRFYPPTPCADCRRICRPLGGDIVARHRRMTHRAETCKMARKERGKQRADGARALVNVISLNKHFAKRIFLKCVLQNSYLARECSVGGDSPPLIFRLAIAAHAERP